MNFTCVHVCVYYVCLFVRMYVCMYVCMYVYTYVCMYVYTYVYNHVYLRVWKSRLVNGGVVVCLAGPSLLTQLWTACPANTPQACWQGGSSLPD